MDPPGPEGRGLVPAIKALFVTSEVAGLAKAGGRSEVSAGLPLVLRRRGVDIRILMPAYRDVMARLPNSDWFGTLPGRAGIKPARLGETRLLDGTIVYPVAAPSLFDRRGTPYCTPEGADWPDNHLHFARLSLAAACEPAFYVYEDERQLTAMRRAAMARCFSWSGAAAAYEALYQRLIGPRTVAVQPKPQAVVPPVAACDAELLEPAA